MASHRGSFGRLGRGRGQGMTRGSNRGGWNSNRAATTPILLPPQPYGPIIDSINIKTLLIEEEAPIIENAEYVASYNWLDSKEPVILVPGSPPTWTPPAKDPQLKPDSEDVFRDINAARFSSYPLEPTVRSVKVMRPDFNLQSVDIVGCGSTIGSLLRFAGSDSKAFRFDVDVVGDTVYFIRKGISPTELITDLRGYGHTFPDAYTTWNAEVGNSCSHQRIIQYQFGGLTFLLRSETDGYVHQPGAKAKSNSKASKTPLEDVVGTMFVSNNTSSKDSPLQIKMKGEEVSQGRIFDLKTRASYKPFDMNEILPRLWLNQTPNFLIAYHEFGLFDQPKVSNVRQDILAWESKNTALLARFHAIIKRIIDVVRDLDKQQCEVSWDGNGPLRITSQIGEGRRVLPFDLLQLLETH